MLTRRRITPLALAALLLVAAAGMTSCTPAQTAVNHATDQIGRPYVYGSATPAAGFDCSGLTSWAWKQAGKTIPRTAAAQYGASRRISKAELQPGDLVFWGSGGRVTHVAMYTGKGRIVQARKAGLPVETQSVDWWASNRIGYGRVA